jgi:type IX secretion system PorP/SprF family membrane protein
MKILYRVFNRRNSKKVAWMIIFLCSIHVLRAQDPFSTSFNFNESSFNPALTGNKEAVSLMVQYKNQWQAAGVPAFRSASVRLEESVPCTMFDHGFHFNVDQEGNGMLTTNTVGWRISGSVPFDLGFSRHNIRIGTGLQWSNKQVDYSKLVFSDQLDRKYGLRDRFGNVNLTNFIPPNDGESNWFFTPSIGLAHRILMDVTEPTSGTLQYGFSFHNAISIGSNLGSQADESILGIGTVIPRRWNAFLSYELIPYLENRYFISVKPLAFWESQGQLGYLQIGSHFSFNRNVGFGVYYHTNRLPKKESNIQWLSLDLQFGSVMRDGIRFDMLASYSLGLSDVRHYTSGILEFGVAVHFQGSPSCGAMGLNDLVRGGNQPKCPTSAFSPAKRKLYENIWYK